MPEVIATITKIDKVSSEIFSLQSFDTTPSSINDFTSIITFIFTSMVDDEPLKERLLSMENGIYRINSELLPHKVIVDIK